MKSGYLGMDETTISKILKGTRNPGLENAIAIERLTGIPVEAWLPTSRDNSVSDEQPQPQKRSA
jgi:transcriptional regulator with XRE-family HTH domain